MNGAGAAVRRVTLVARGGTDNTCHQTNEASMSESPNHATMFRILPPFPKRSPMLFFQIRPQLFLRYRSISNRAPAVAFEHRCFNAETG